MKHEYLRCDKCGYSEENAGCQVFDLTIQKLKPVLGSDKTVIDMIIDVIHIDLCADCLRTYNLKNPDDKIYEA